MDKQTDSCAYTKKRLLRALDVLLAVGAVGRVAAPPRRAPYLFCVCVCVCVCERERERERVCVCVDTCLYVHTHTQTHAHAHAHIHTHTHTRAHTHTKAAKSQVCVFQCVFVCVHTHAHTHTHTCTHRRRNHSRSCAICLTKKNLKTKKKICLTGGEITAHPVQSAAWILCLR